MQHKRVLRITTALILVALGGGCPAMDADSSRDDGGSDTSRGDSGPETYAADPMHQNAPVVMAAATVSSAGGLVKTQDGALAVQVPSGALDHDVKVTVESASAPAAGAVGTVFEIGPTGTQFKQPVTISLNFAGEDASELRVATYADGAWQVLPNSVFDAEHHTISGDTMHLSPYALVRMTCVPAAASGGCDSSGCSQPSCDSMSCSAYPGAQLSCMEMPQGAAASCCFAPGAQMCATRSVGGCSGTGAPSASGGGGSSAPSTALDAGAPMAADASVRLDAPPPPADQPPKYDPYAPDSGSSSGGAYADASIELRASDAGVPPSEPLAPPSCDKPSCASSPACGGAPGAMRSACHDTDTGFEETCCYAADMLSAPPTSSAGGDAGVRTDPGTGGSGSGSDAPSAAIDASAGDVKTPPPPPPGTGGTGADTGSGGTSGSIDASVPPPPEPQPPKA